MVLKDLSWFTSLVMLAALVVGIPLCGIVLVITYGITGFVVPVFDGTAVAFGLFALWTFALLAVGILIDV